MRSWKCCSRGLHGGGIRCGVRRLVFVVVQLAAEVVVVWYSEAVLEHQAEALIYKTGHQCLML